jgi:hypothetical protein
MWKKTLSVVALASAFSIPLASAGCESNKEKPNAVTGETPSAGLDPAAYDQFGKYHPEWEGKPWMNPRYQDQKGHYHPEWVGESGH